ncbi:MAG: hypothetical protein V3S07_03720 [Micropepsaceae bacterium]
MMIFRAMFWLSIVTILMPQEAAPGPSEATNLLDRSTVAASELTASPGLLEEFQAIVQRKLYNLKEYRAAQKNMETETEA